MTFDNFNIPKSNFSFQETNSRFFKALTETIPHILYVADLDLKIIYINQYQPGYTEANVIGNQIFTFISPEYVDLYKTKIQEVLKTGKPLSFELMGASGNNSQGKAWYKTSISAIKQHNNTITNLLFISEDITAHKLNEAKLIDSTEKLKAIFNNTSDYICSIDKDFKLMEFNKSFIKAVKLGYAIEPIFGMPILDVIDPAKHKHLTAIYIKVLQGKIHSEIEAFEPAGFSTVYFESNYHPILNSNNEISGINIFSKNITKRILNENSLKETLKEKESLLSEIHHRIKNNLTIISSILQLQELNIENNEAKAALKQSIKRIKSAALIHELFYKSTLLSSINLNKYICELFDLLKIDSNFILELSGDEIKLDISQAMPIGLIINELMTNSFKHSYNNAKKGKITMRFALNESATTISYCDCAGSFPENIDFDNSTSTGLTLIHTFVKQLDGTIKLTERIPPKYVISLPKF
ncbi:MAG: PAS domain S-box protein [Bacteroidetes bacterium]|nr:PAS domain S-box protein [Bacteroidota bacterium]